MMGYILSFSPESAGPGDSIMVESQGVGGMEGEVAVLQGARWVPADGIEAVMAPSVIINDDEEYTLFTATLPQVIRTGKYSLEIYLDIGTEHYVFNSDALTLDVTGAGEGDKPYISRITPSRTTREELNNTRFKIFGNNVDQIENWTIMSRPSKIRMVSLGGGSSGESVSIKASTVPQGIKPGNYKLQGKAINGGQILSPIPISIE